MIAALADILAEMAGFGLGNPDDSYRVTESSPTVANNSAGTTRDRRI
jgi:hypothetical protein